MNESIAAKYAENTTIGMLSTDEEREKQTKESKGKNNEYKGTLKEEGTEIRHQTKEPKHGRPFLFSFGDKAIRLVLQPL